ncbi:MAG: glycosyltransferase family 39 protein [Caldilineaceae bacterium]|nr:glycosyltransferase family 39 protein [Caldilineaceae bacterium]MBP8105994.1 glycosyltransferase family 39 protein [Caldilineaceae bacterium]MBP8123680.1 glycosyltransferase family 39 protein [Caldilineaceae bacterium]MBP9071914.1 glycosyltransferase family 39 protein [Caldilineaceae bacterium]
MTDEPQQVASPPVFMSKIPYLPELLILALAALTRFWRLDFHSFWFDEAVSLQWAAADPAYTWDVTLKLVQEKHPPVYYITLHYWQAGLELLGLGHSDAGLRALGSLLGVLTVLVMILLVRRVSGRVTALLTGTLVALSPVMVWYSQELRMFQPAATGIAWAAYFLIRAWESERFPPRLGWWAGMVAAFLFALYAYLFSAFILPPAGLTLLLLAGRRWGRKFWEGVVAFALTGALYLPLARNAWLINSAESAPGQAFANFLPTVWRHLRVFTVWQADWPAGAVTGAVLLAAILSLAAGFSFFLKKDGHFSINAAGAAWPTLWVSLPWLMGNVLLASNGGVFKEDRYFIFLAPFVLWLMAMGIVNLARWRPGVGWTAGGLMVLALAAALPTLWTPALYREDWRAAASYIADYQDTSPVLPSAVVAHVDYTHRPVDWYLQPRYTFDQLPVYGLFGGILTPEQVETVIAPPLSGIETALGASTVWLTQSHLEGLDDQGLVEQWLAARYPVITEQYPAGIKLTGYAIRTHFDALPDLAPGAVYPDAELAPGLVLRACEITTPTVNVADTRLHPPSGWVHVRLWWQASGPIAEDLRPTVRVQADSGIWGEKLERPNQILDRFPMSAWAVGDIVRDEADVNLNPLTPPGDYPLLVSLDSSTVPCGMVEIKK